ncbi:WYL domain-containing protein (plasmid) [Azospirillum ramasamyi]|uniref:WYL domain-containing protein n=2 Tax=Azospirillum ramasamyi TaxID=682998 RepID=A0A2U9SCC2_9PROT|nr:WYL domain-containing protein [Azospirillum ramasamyi]
MSIHSVDDLKGVRNGAAIIRRLRWIDDRLYWHGSFRRSDMVTRFSLSPQQASADISQYQQIVPANAVLDPSTKGYVRAEGFQPLFLKDAFAWMRQGRETGDLSVLPCESVPIPARRADAEIMMALIGSYETRTALSIRYQSLTSAEPSQRVICPHHIVDHGPRVHVRAWDDRRRIFTDFVVGRILSAEPEPSYPWVDQIADTLWHETVTVRLAPHPGLSATQRAVVEREHCMHDGEVAVPVRKAMVLYFLDGLGLLDAVREGDGTPDATRGVRCLDAAALRPLLPASGPQPQDHAPRA